MVDSLSTAEENTQKLQNAIRAVHQKKPVPEIDFTLHTMEDGTQVSTLERVCKGMNIILKHLSSPLHTFVLVPVLWSFPFRPQLAKIMR